MINITFCYILVSFFHESYTYYSDYIIYIMLDLLQKKIPCLTTKAVSKVSFKSPYIYINHAVQIVFAIEIPYRVITSL